MCSKAILRASWLQSRFDEMIQTQFKQQSNKAKDMTDKETKPKAAVLFIEKCRKDMITNRDHLHSPLLDALRDSKIQMGELVEANDPRHDVPKIVFAGNRWEFLRHHSLQAHVRSSFPQCRAVAEERQMEG